MTIVAIILGWMLVNTWIALIWCKLDHTFISEWDEYLALFVVSIVSVPIMLLIKHIITKVKKVRENEVRKK